MPRDDDSEYSTEDFDRAAAGSGLPDPFASVPPEEDNESDFREAQSFLEESEPSQTSPRVHPGDQFNNPSVSFGASVSGRQPKEKGSNRAEETQIGVDDEDSRFGDDGSHFGSDLSWYEQGSLLPGDIGSHFGDEDSGFGASGQDSGIGVLDPSVADSGLQSKSEEAEGLPTPSEVQRVRADLEEDGFDKSTIIYDRETPADAKVETPKPVKERIGFWDIRKSPALNLVGRLASRVAYTFRSDAKKISN